MCKDKIPNNNPSLYAREILLKSAWGIKESTIQRKKPQLQQL